MLYGLKSIALHTFSQKILQSLNSAVIMFSAKLIAYLLIIYIIAIAA